MRSIHRHATFLMIALGFVVGSFAAVANEICDAPEFERPIVGSIKLLEEKVVRMHVSKSAVLNMESGKPVYVWRGGKEVAQMKITKPTESGCLAKLESLQDGITLKDGDRAVYDTTLNVVLEMPMDAKYESANLAKQHAKSDLQLGLKRILRYGQPRTDDVVDRETKLPTRVVAGCVVSKSLVEFVDEYNRVVRESVLKDDELSETLEDGGQ